MEPSVAFQPPTDAQQPSLPAPVWRILLFGVMALAAGVGLAHLATRKHVEILPGQLSARIVPITADRDGVIIRWHVGEGDAVEIGQTLASMADPSIDRRRQELDAEISRLESELDRALAKADLELDWRMKDVHETIFAARLQSAEYLEEKHLHEMEKVALTDLLNHNATVFATPPDTVVDSLVLKDSGGQSSRLKTVLQLEAATNSTEVCAAQVALCDEQVSWLEELKETLPERVRKSVGVDIAEQDLEIAKAELEALEDVEARSLIASSAIGRAGVFFKRVGDYAAVGEPVVEVMDDSRRFVVIDVPSDLVAEYTVGRTLSVVFPGGVKRSGRVLRVAPQVLQQGEAGSGNPVVRVHIEQAGKVWPTMPIGTQVDTSL